MRVKDIVLIGMLSALLTSVKFSLSFLPSIELVSLFIIIYTLTMHRKTLYIIGVFVTVEGFLYGFGLWFYCYLYIWYILYFLVKIFRKNQSPFFWAILSACYGFSFGALCTVPNFFLGLSSGSIRNGFQSAFAAWINGIPFDIPHGIANFFITLVLFKPLIKIFQLITNEAYSH